MCYDVSYSLLRAIRQLKARGGDPEYLKQLEAKYKQLNPHRYHVNGFSHDVLPVITDRNPNEIQLFEWGLIPTWAKDRSFQSSTLNARSEDMFEKPSYKNSVTHKRCLILLNGFYEHHHFKKKSYPFYFCHPKDEPMILAGLWSEWNDVVKNMNVKTVTIITCRANMLLSKIHNNPKQKEPRMPVILATEQAQRTWLEAKTQEEIRAVCLPYEGELKFHTVMPLRGKHYLGDVPGVIEPFRHPELDLDEDVRSIF